MTISSAIDQVCVRCTLQDFVVLAPGKLTADYRQAILASLKRTSEGVCTRHGFVLPGSVSVVTISPGHIQSSSLNGNVCFKVTYQAHVCNPANGSTVPAQVKNINRFGILARSYVRIDDAVTLPVMEIIVTKQNNMSELSDVEMSKIQVGDMIVIEVMGKRFQLGDDHVSIVGKIISRQPSAETSIAHVSTEETTDDMVLDDQDSASIGESEDDDNEVDVAVDNESHADDDSDINPSLVNQDAGGDDESVDDYDDDSITESSARLNVEQFTEDAISEADGETHEDEDALFTDGEDFID